MNTSQHSVGTQSKSVYVQGLGIRGIPASKGGTPGQGYSKYKNPSVEVYAERWEQGLDIWTGEPLTGDGLADWEKQKKRRNRMR